MHDDQNEKNFTLSRLSGLPFQYRNPIPISASSSYHYQITGFSKPLVQWMATWVKNLPLSLKLHNLPFRIQGCAIALPATTYDQLWRKPRRKTLALHFRSPTSFNSQGHHFPFPVPRNLFHSYLRRWNTFATQTFEMEPFLDWVDRNVIVLRHELRTVKTAAGKFGAVTGFLGNIELGLSSKTKQADYIQLFHALGHFAPYCGTGHKTPFGLGMTQLGWKSLKPHSKPELSPDGPTLEKMVAEKTQRDFENRIQSLIKIFVAQKKRQGGDRARQSATLWATVLARRERGDSLQEIADDLEIPYISAKTYSKLARRALRQAEETPE